MTIHIEFSNFREFEIEMDSVKQFLEEQAQKKKSLIFFALLEAINNAIEHSLATISQPRLDLSIYKKEGQLQIVLVHNGVTFDYEKKLQEIADPGNYLETHLTDLRGRGIPIMLQCADSLTYSDGGRMIQLTFDIG